MAPWLKFCSFFFSLTACLDGQRLAVSAGGTSSSRKGPVGDACGWRVSEGRKKLLGGGGFCRLSGLFLSANCTVSGEDGSVRISQVPRVSRGRERCRVGRALHR